MTTQSTTQSNWSRMGLIALALLVLFGSGYIPMPVVITKDLTIAFPCQHKGCGCRDADQCWDACCCHTDDEKLQWAQRNHVQPPVWFLERMERAGGRKTVANQGAPSCCCCAKSPSPGEPRETSVLLSLKQQRHCQGQRDDVLHLKLLCVRESELVFFTDPPSRAFSVSFPMVDSTPIKPPVPPG